LIISGETGRISYDQLDALEEECQIVAEKLGNLIKSRAKKLKNKK